MEHLKQLSFLLILLSLSIPRSAAYTQRDLLRKQTEQTKLENCLLLNREWVSYPDYPDREGWQKLLGPHVKTYIKRGEELLNYTWKVVRASDYLTYERTGNRTIMESPLSSNNNALSALMMAELAEGKGRFIDPIIDGCFATCEMTSWALSAHLSVQKSHRSLPEYDDQVIDLVSGDIGSLLAWIHYFFRQEFDRQNPAIAKRIRYEIEKRILTPYLADDRYWWMALGKRPGSVLVNNWNPWCNFNMLQCFLLMGNDRTQIQKGVQKTMRSVDQFINYVKTDGACEEGPSYWGHAAGKLYDYLQLLYDATGGKIDLFGEPSIRAMGEYIVRSYVGNGWVVNFADASAKNGMDIPLIYSYGKAVKSEEMKAFAARLRRQQGEPRIGTGRDIARTLRAEQVKAEIEQTDAECVVPECTWYPETEFCYMKNRNGIFFAAKAGFNNESHNHNDVGTFSMYADETPVFVDAGVGTYTRQTFSNERYTIWTMQSDFHNLPIINGASQSYGSRYKATEVKFNNTKRRFSADIAAAYPESARVRSWVRSYTLTDKGITIEERFRLDSLRAPNRICFMTQGECDLSKAGEIAIRTDRNRTVLRYDKKLFTATTETIPLTDKRLSNVWGEQLYRIVLTARKTALSGTYTYTIETTGL